MVPDILSGIGVTFSDSETEMSQAKSSFQVLSLGALMFGAHEFYTGNEKLHRDVLIPMCRTFYPETVHQWAIWSAKYGLVKPRIPTNLEHVQKPIKVFGLQFPGPIGLAAGFDKQGLVPCEMLDYWGFDFVEIGSVTPEPQEGNPKPRVFRLVEDKAVINRFGFNSDGHEAVYQRLHQKLQSRNHRGIIGVNLGKNKTSPVNDASDFVKGVAKFGELADYLVINISSPNTPGLRRMQQKEVLRDTLKQVLKQRDQLKKRTPLLVKISPDESDESLQDIADIVTSKECHVDGLIVTNTTLSRENLLHPESSVSQEAGGLSGAPLRARSTRVVARMYELTGRGKMPIIACGGVFTGADAAEKLAAGATLVQFYTALVYEGPPVVGKIKRELNLLMAEKQKVESNAQRDVSA